VRAAEAARDAARLRLERTTVTSPADGVVLERLAQPGSVLAEGGAPVCTLFDPAHLRIRVDIPQGDIGKISTGQRVEILADARAGEPYHGEVVRLLQKADIQKVTLQAHVRVTDADALLRPEMLCQVRFLGEAGNGDASASDAVSIPARLLGADGSVWVIDGVRNVAVRRAVEVGARSGERVEIRSGLNLSDKLIDEGRAALRDGSRVRVQGGP
jgi:HlyD family secretion protein